MKNDEGEADSIIKWGRSSLHYMGKNEEKFMTYLKFHREVDKEEMFVYMKKLIKPC